MPVYEPEFRNRNDLRGVASTVPVMTEEFSAAEASKYLGLTTEAVHKAVRENRLATLPGEGPVRVSLEAVEAFHQLRQESLVASLARRGETPVSVARRVRAALFRSDTGLPHSFAAKLAAMPADWRALFSRAELAAACVKDGDGCRWCRSLEFAEFLGLRPVEYAPAYVELFGAPPCGTCGPGLMRPYMEALRARVHRGAERPSAPPSPPSAAQRQAAREWAVQRARTAAVKPVEDDDGRAWVNRRLQQTRARLKDAKRSGDQRRAIQLTQTLKALTADARVIEERASKRGQR